ncbi:heterokaryon incompatibility protein-domain-containing protein [Phaeosphaeria sp. MPI-PUGE-AT-0046c]|nr:heterokaryon incompatibility protein-domain-containing protein [Phaeosphaeria sp. MPI-PUGE-AT-0046c]
MADSPAPAESVYDTVRLPLGKTMCIRVVKIRPSTTSDRSDPIICDFSILDVENGTVVHDGDLSRQPTHDASTNTHGPERLEYQALSYTWGDPPANYFIELDGTPFTVRENLWDFLHQARKSSVTGYLWIDAICIDQTTVGERNHQVGMMREIYSQAECVIVWLGESSYEDQNNLMLCLEALDNYRSRWEVPHHHRKMAERFMSLDYWTRAWIVQEYHLARRKTIWYGELRLTPQSAEKLDDYARYSFRDRSPASTLWSVQNCLQPTNSLRKAAAVGKFCKLLAIFEKLKCVDSRDLVFALLPLLTSEERETIGIYPDYSKSATSLFLDVFKCCTSSFKKLQSYAWLPSIFRLDSILSPDWQDTAVQSAILDIRAEYSFLGWVPLRPWDHTDHLCVRIHNAIVDNKGCTLCRLRPFVTSESSKPMRSAEIPFSRRDWGKYVHALLVSENEGDRTLGIKYCHDPNLKLGIDLNRYGNLGPDLPRQNLVERAVDEKP